MSTEGSGADARAIPPVGARFRPADRILRIGIVVIIALALFLLATALRQWLGDAESESRAVVTPVEEVSGPEAEAVLRALSAEPVAEAPAPVAEPLPVPIEPLFFDPIPVVASPVDPGVDILRRKGESEILVYRAKGDGGQAPPAPASTDPVATPAAGTALGRALQPTAAATGHATLLTDLDTRLLQGTLISCVLETAISSSVPGLLTCRNRLPVYSANGAYELIPRGTRIVGEYRGALRDGQTRLFALWNRLVTPSGVAVSLASPGAGPLGRGGHSGELDRRWGDRFAAALLVSVISDAAARSTEGEFEESRAALRAVAAESVRTELAVHSELTKNPGERITIIVARDVAFGESMAALFEARGQADDLLLWSD